MSSLFLQNLRDAVRISDKETEVIVDSRESGVYVGAYNLSHTVVFSSVEEGWEHFTAAIPQATAHQLAGSLSEEKLSLRVVEGVLIAKSKGVNIKVPLVDTKMSIARLANKYAKDTICTVTDLSQGVNLVKYAANDKTIGDIVLQGYHLVLKEDRAEIMASNGAVMALTTVPASGIGKGEEQVLLLNPNFNQLVPFLSGEVEIGIKDNTVSFTKTEGNRSLRIVSALTKGTPFDFVSVLDRARENDVTLTLPTPETASALKGMDYFTDDKNHNRLNISLHKSSILMDTVNDNGSVNTEVEVIEGLGLPEGGIQMMTSYDNLKGFINTTKSPQFGLKVKDGKTPIYMTDTEDENDFFTLRAMSVVFS